MFKKLKLFLVITLILCFLFFLYRRKKLHENFDCVKIDKSLFCLKEKEDIDSFRGNKDTNYINEIPDFSFYNLNDLSDITFNYKKFSYYNIDFPEFKNFSHNLNYKDRLKTIEVDLKDGKKKKKYKYDYIDCGKVKDKLKDKLNNPGGVLFNKFNDDVIIFDAFKLRTFSYRDMKFKDLNSLPELPKVKNYLPILEGIPIEIKNVTDKNRDEFNKLLYALENFPSPNIINQDYYDKYNSKSATYNYDDEKIEGEYRTLMKKINDVDNVEIVIKDEILKTNITYNKETLKQRLIVLEKSFNNSKKYKVCLKDIDSPEEKKKCQIKYQEDLPSFDMGRVEGKGIEGMQYDDDKPQTNIHSSFIDNRMEPWLNSWNNVEMEGVFSPLIIEEKKKMKLIKTDGVQEGEGEAEGIKQISGGGTPKLYNDTIISSNAYDNENNIILDENINNHTFIEEFENYSKKSYQELKDKYQLMDDKSKKISYGYPSIGLDIENRDKNIYSAGLYKLPDELDTTGIGMELVDIGETKIILVPDVNNNRIQVFRIVKAEVEYYGQFGNLDYTSKRSLPLKGDNNDYLRYEQIHDTDKYNSQPGCEKTCHFNVKKDYIGARNVDFLNRKCESWKDYIDPNDPPNKKIDEDYKLIPLKNKKILGNIKTKINNGEILDNRCQSIETIPMCVVRDNDKSILSKCFSTLNSGGENDREDVTDEESCDKWIKNYTDKFGPIDVNMCLGDNVSQQLTPQEIKEGKIPISNCKFECDNKYSYRRANIHQRQSAYKNGEGEVFRKRGHFFSLLDEYNRCLNGIKLDDIGIKTFNDAEFINPHFLGVDSQACLGAKAGDGFCKTKDKRNTNGIDECSLGYRKYLLKIIAATNQGQKFGQLFHPKSIAYDDIDKKYYVIDCYHHSVQCFELEDKKISNSSGEKLSFVSADKNYNDEHIFYYDENFSTGEGRKYNSTPVYSLGLRQNLLYEDKFENFSRTTGNVSDDETPYIKEHKRVTKKIKEFPEIMEQLEIYKEKMRLIYEEYLDTTNELIKEDKGTYSSNKNYRKSLYW